ncbi:MAG: 3-methylitaconate isomerase, partial [Deltaproteobacteria bacterium]|nr:3-methylitaconate isomerase [Deltaproteobacteria bacterium]
IEGPAEINGNPDLLRRLEDIRAQVAVMIGMAPDVAAATKNSPAFPMIAMVSPPRDYKDFTSGRIISAADVSLVSRLMFMQVLHKTYAGTGTVCTGAAAKIPGTIVYEMVPDNETTTIIKIGHPAGVIDIEAAVENGLVTRAAFARTARRLMDGQVYVLRNRIES